MSVPPNSPYFMKAAHFAVVGRVLEDEARFDNKVLWWYKDRKLDVVGVRPKSERFDNSKPVDGVRVYDDVVSPKGVCREWNRWAWWAWFGFDGGLLWPLASDSIAGEATAPFRRSPQTLLPDLAHTSLSMIISPALGLTMMEKLFPPTPSGNEPHAVWFQPGAESDDIWAFVKARGIQNKVVIGDHACILVSGDQAMVEPARM